MWKRDWWISDKDQKIQCSSNPETKYILNVDGIKPLKNIKMGLFHTKLDRGLVLFKRTRPYIQPTIAVLCTIVKHPNQGYCNKQLRLMRYTLGTQELCLKLKADKTSSLKQYAYEEFAVHLDFKSHVGSTLRMGKGEIVSMSRKQILNVESSTGSKFVGTDDVSSLILCIKIFLEAKGYKFEQNIIYQDN